MEKPQILEKDVDEEEQSRAQSLSGNADQHGDIISKADSTNSPDEEYEYVTGYKLFLVIFIVTLACFLMLLDTSIIVTAIPKITTDFHSLGDVGWYGSAYLLTSSCLQPMTGKVYTHFSSKTAYIFFIGIFELGSLLCGVAQSSTMLIIGRAVAGMGVAGLQNGSLTILSACIPLEKRAVYLGFMMSFAQMGILFGPLIGGALTQYTTWRWCFYINLPAGAVVVGILLFIQIPDRVVKVPGKSMAQATFAALDLGGFAIFAPMMVMFLLALQWGGSKYAWGSATIIGLFCGAAGTLPLFLYWEYRKGDAAMIPLSIIRQRIPALAMTNMFFMSGTIFITSYYLAIWFQAVRGDTPTMSGVSMLPGIISQMIFAILSGALVGRLGYYLPWAVFSGVLSAIGSGLLSSYTPTTSMANWIGFQIVGGIGRGCGMQMSIVAISHALPQSQNAIAMALIIFCQAFGGSIWLAVSQTTLSSSLANALPKYAPGISAKIVADAGATGFRAVIPEESIDGVIMAYNVAISHVFYIAAGAAVGSFLVAWGLGWKSVKKAKVVAPEA